MGYPEYKKMFLHYSSAIQKYKGENSPYYASINLNPTNCENISSMYVSRSKTVIPNWDKIRVTAIYVSIQPNANTWDGSASKQIFNIECFYVPGNFGKDYQIERINDKTDGESIQKDLKRFFYSKQVFTFSSNDTFSFVLKAPETMYDRGSTALDSTLTDIKPKYTWWSVRDLYCPDKNFVQDTRNEDYNESESGSEYSDEEVETVNPDEGYGFTCGSLVFKASSEFSFTYTINYKVQLKG